MHYQKLKEGWEKAALTNANAAIHPAGNSSFEDYAQSGVDDVNKLLHVMQEHGYGPEHLEYLEIIDFGCGNGRMTDPLSALFKHVHAVDISYKMLQQLPKHESITPVLAADSRFLIPGEVADVAVSVSVFIHNTHADGVHMLQQISNNLVIGAHAFLQIPIYATAKEPSDWTDVGVWTLDQLEMAAESAGMEVVQYHTNPGSFSFDNIGTNHAAFQVLKKISSDTLKDVS